MVSFYDVLIDLILLDAFDDLTNPPSSVVSVANNRWLSNGFKESVRMSIVYVYLNIQLDVHVVLVSG